MISTTIVACRSSPAGGSQASTWRISSVAPTSARNWAGMPSVGICRRVVTVKARSGRRPRPRCATGRRSRDLRGDELLVGEHRRHAARVGPEAGLGGDVHRTPLAAGAIEANSRARDLGSVPVSTLSDLVTRHTDLDPADVEWLHLLVGDWQLVSDLAFADLVLWLPTAGRASSRSPRPGRRPAPPCTTTTSWARQAPEGQRPQLERR